MWEYLKTDLWKLARVVIVVGVSLLVSWKMISSANLVNIDFATLLSVLLAFFSVALSVAFYFKATDTSNTFYDNTYKFTQDIAGLLVKIESGFGEKLKSIDENYGRMRGYIESSRSPAAGELKENLKDEKEQFDKVLNEREKLIEELLAKANMQEGERATFHEMLKAKDEELKRLNREVSRMSRDLTVDRVLSGRTSVRGTRRQVHDFIISKVAPSIFDGSRSRVTTRQVRNRFAELANDLPSDLLMDMESLGYFHDGELTESGVDMIIGAKDETRRPDLRF